MVVWGIGGIVSGEEGEIFVWLGPRRDSYFADSVRNDGLF